MDSIQYLSQFNLLNNLSTEDLMEMEEMTSITAVPANTLIQTPSTFTEGLFFVKKGKVRLYQLSSTGKQFTLDILSEGNVFGEMAGISLGTRELFIDTLDDCDICLMNKDRFEGFLLSRPRFMLNLIQTLSSQFNEMGSLMLQLALGDLRFRLAHILLRLSRRFGCEEQDGLSRINLSLSHQELANMVGATREAVSGVLRQWNRDGLVQTGFKTVRIHPERLEKLISDRL
ncbi:Crp/Fnr family transcriptional regulator [Paenibacillus sp. sgz500992]|uniref:Crp/Fnr family transcriptional regulator n=1 Tax=Paenibacillus sp. sgz500992 TaxID=3242476 RepID=UPI0036D3B23D